jgi:hypothetical protein
MSLNCLFLLLIAGEVWGNVRLRLSIGNWCSNSAIGEKKGSVNRDQRRFDSGDKPYGIRRAEFLQNNTKTGRTDRRFGRERRARPDGRWQVSDGSCYPLAGVTGRLPSAGRTEST